MKFPVKFLRYVGTAPADGIALGADTDPNTSVPGAQQLPDNAIAIPMNPQITVNRVVIGYHSTAGSPPDLTADLYLYDAQSAFWYKLTSAPFSLSEGVLTPMGIVGGPIVTAPSEDATKNVQLVLVVAAGVDPPNGTYTFVMIADRGVGDPLFAGA